MRIVRVNKGGGIALVSLTCGQIHGFKAAFIHARLLLRGKVNQAEAKQRHSTAPTSAARPRYAAMLTC